MPVAPVARPTSDDRLTVDGHGPAMGGPTEGGGTVPGVMEAADAAEPGPRRRVALVASGLAVVVLLALLVATFVRGGDDGEGTSTGTTDPSAAVPDRLGAPDVEAMMSSTLLTPDGEETTLDELIGDRAVLVNQWSRTCAPCVEEMLWLDADLEGQPADRGHRHQQPRRRGHREPHG